MIRQRLPQILGALGILLLLAFPFIYGGSDYDFVMHLWITAFFHSYKKSSQN